MLFIYVKYREHRIQHKERQEAEVARTISELEKRALQAQMNPHFIYNCMNSIQQFMILHDFEGAMKYLTRFSRLLRTVLNMSAQHRIALSDEIKLIEDYLELENMRFPNKFSYEINIASDLDIHSTEIPPFFIQPQVENAIRHGLINKSAPGHLRVQIARQNQHIRIIVEDNGIGREASIAAKQTDRIIHESKGLAIVKERLTHLHPENGAHPLHITDLYDTEGKASGTRVEITLPLE
jgi:LytS/YehU family sensor histidine kinase